MRSLLFVPGDSTRKLEKSLTAGADALLIDLEDSVAPDAKAAARETTAGFLRELHEHKKRPRLYVRVNALDTGLTDADLDAVMPAGPDGLMLPKASGGPDISHLGAKIAVREAEGDLPDGATRIIAIATETARAMFGLGTYGRASHRLIGLAWGAEDLSADHGAQTNKDANGKFTEPYRLARSMLLYAAAAAEVLAIDTVFTDLRDLDRLRSECAEAVRDGFSAKMAIHPAQVPVINEVFTPSDEAVAHARAIIDAFAANSGAGVVSVDGQMVDRPHIVRAERVLARAKAASALSVSDV
jgi:citrate lyase subunit beta/citryl-CoA lyase